MNAKTHYCPIKSTDILFVSREMENYGQYNDLLIVSVSRRLDQPLLTFDNDLGKACKRFEVKTIG